MNRSQGKIGVYIGFASGPGMTKLVSDGQSDRHRLRRQQVKGILAKHSLCSRRTGKDKIATNAKLSYLLSFGHPHAPLELEPPPAHSPLDIYLNGYSPPRMGETASDSSSLAAPWPSPSLAPRAEILLPSETRRVGEGEFVRWSAEMNDMLDGVEEPRAARFGRWMRQSSRVEEGKERWVILYVLRNPWNSAHFASILAFTTAPAFSRSLMSSWKVP